MGAAVADGLNSGCQIGNDFDPAKIFSNFNFAREKPFGNGDLSATSSSQDQRFSFEGGECATTSGVEPPGRPGASTVARGG